MFSRIARSFRSSKPAAKATKAAVAPTFESLENRQLMSVSPLVVGFKTKTKNLFANGISTNQSVVTIPFTGNVNIADASKIQVRGYATNPTNGHQKKMVVNVLSATVLAGDHSYIQLTTDRLVRKGGKIYFYSGALTDDSSNLLADQTTTCRQGQNKERFTLACRGFVPQNVSMFTPDLYSAATAPTTANTAVPEGTVTTALSNFLQSKVNKGLITAAQMTTALATYNNATNKLIVPDANMRAAIVSLTGTLAESAISSFLTGNNLSGKPYTIVGFENPPDSSAVVAESIVGSNGRLRTVVKPTFQGEPFQVLSAYLAHEALHQDSAVSLQEEEMANVAEIMVYAQQALVDSSFLNSGTSLVRTENDKLYAFLESGQAIFPYVGLLDAPIQHASNGIFIGAGAQTGGVYTSYINYIKRIYQARGSQPGNTAGDPILKTYYTAITGKTAPTSLGFSDTLISDIDSFQGVVGTKQAILLAGDLKLTI